MIGQTLNWLTSVSNVTDHCWSWFCLIFPIFSCCFSMSTKCSIISLHFICIYWLQERLTYLVVTSCWKMCRYNVGVTWMDMKREIHDEIHMKLKTKKLKLTLAWQFYFILDSFKKLIYVQSREWFKKAVFFCLFLFFCFLLVWFWKTVSLCGSHWRWALNFLCRSS